jgi:hypothetical protein
MHPRVRDQNAKRPVGAGCEEVHPVEQSTGIRANRARQSAAGLRRGRDSGAGSIKYNRSR